MSEPESASPIVRTSLQYGAIYVALMILEGLGALLFEAFSDKTIVDAGGWWKINILVAACGASWLFARRERREIRGDEFAKILFLSWILGVASEVVLTLLLVQLGAVDFSLEAGTFLIAFSVVGAIQLAYLAVSYRFPGRWIARGGLRSTVDAA